MGSFRGLAARGVIFSQAGDRCANTHGHHCTVDPRLSRVLRVCGTAVSQWDDSQ
jgi:hypothetical protein